MIPPFLIEFAIKYGVKIIAVLVLIAAYWFWHHHVYKSGYAEAVGLYEARGAKDAVKAAAILAAAKKSVEDKALEHERILNEVLTQNDEDKKNLNTQLAAALTRGVYVNTKANESSRNTLPGKAVVQQGDAGGGESTCNQELAGDNQRKLVAAEYEIARLADLHLSCVAQIERTHTLK